MRLLAMMRNERCRTCKIGRSTIINPTSYCCEWFSDNVIDGDKTTDDCTEYIPYKNEEVK